MEYHQHYIITTLAEMPPPSTLLKAGVTTENYESFHLHSPFHFFVFRSSYIYLLVLRQFFPSFWKEQLRLLLTSTRLID